MESSFESIVGKFGKVKKVFRDSHTGYVCIEKYNVKYSKHELSTIPIHCALGHQVNFMAFFGALRVEFTQFVETPNPLPWLGLHFTFYSFNMWSKRGLLAYFILKPSWIAIAVGSNRWLFAYLSLPNHPLNHSVFDRKVLPEFTWITTSTKPNLNSRDPFLLDNVRSPWSISRFRWGKAIPKLMGFWPHSHSNQCWRDQNKIETIIPPINSTQKTWWKKNTQSPHPKKNVDKQKSKNNGPFTKKNILHFVKHPAPTKICHREVQPKISPKIVSSPAMSWAMRPMRVPMPVAVTTPRPWDQVGCPRPKS